MAKANSAFMQPKNLSPELEAVVGKGPMPRSEVVKQLWVYIKGHGLQDTKDKKMINTDEKLEKVFGVKSIHMLKMGGVIGKHLS